jgi:uncharacterized membrane protein YfcA
MSATTAKRFKGILIALTGFGAGLLNGLLGAAGGILLVAVLPRLASSDPSPSVLPLAFPPMERRDTLATVTAVMIPVSGVSWLFYLMGGISPPAGMLPLLILPAVSGGLVGAKLLGRLPDRVLRKLFAALVVVSGARMLF